ncbi:MAG: hypothetical protein AAF657_27605 [Acidobacteriota bacterium]
MTEAVELRVAQTWDGTAISVSEQVLWRLSRAADGLRIEVDAPFHHDPPPPGQPGPCEGLWDYEVAELFIVGRSPAGWSAESAVGVTGPATEPEYTELELSPHGHYLLLRLRGVRQAFERRLEMPYRARIVGHRWHGEALLPSRWLPPAPHRVNAFAIHGSGRHRRYLAMTPVPGSAPDFHRLADFKPLVLPGLS